MTADAQQVATRVAKNTAAQVAAMASTVVSKAVNHHRSGTAVWCRAGW